MMIARRLKGWLLAGGLLLTAPAWAVAAGLKVESHGDHGRPIILVPGLGGGAWVWQDTARALQDGHKVYVVTLPGFDGTPPPAGGNAMDQAEAALIALMRAWHLDKPVLVGHSLGGTLALKIASEHPQLLGGVVAVDGLPVFPGSENLAPAQRQAMAASMQTQLQSATPAQFLAQQIAYMRRIGVFDEAKAELYGKRNATS
jgi:pimeloyl-ACP methyl ester carboxylesterase